jgi:cell division protein FtsN
MPRDYKHAKRRSNASELSQGAGLLIGLALGLAVAAAIYLYDRRPGAHVQAPAAPIASEHPKAEKPTPQSRANESGTQFDFYDVLPNFEVVIPEKDKDVRRNTAGTSIDKPGSYVLQVGSYRNFADADRVRAQLAMQGVESKVQKITVDNDTWHRVRIGPISNLKTLEETRRKVREAQMDALVIKVGD